MSNGQPPNVVPDIGSQPVRPPVDWTALMQKLGPFFTQLGQPRQPQGGMPAVPGTAPQMPLPPTLSMGQESPLDIKADPRASVGSLPTPIAQPQREVQPYQPYQGRYPLTPRNQGVYDAIQGMSGFVQRWAQKKDQSQHAEAANAAQALMQAIDSGDYVSANDILHQNEKLFNKVYKGWLQRAKEAQAPPEKADPDVQGFESGLQSYLQGKSQTAPQASRTLGQSKSAPGGYYLPRATPTQQAQGQQASSLAQALQQQPAMSVPGQVVSPEERVKLQESFNKMYGDFQKSQLEFQTKQAEFQKAQLEIQGAQAKSTAEQETAKQNAAHAASEASAAASRLDVTKTQLLIEQAKLRGVQTGKGAKVPASIQKQFSALGQASQLLKTIDPKKGFAPNVFMSLQNLLTTAGLPTYSKSLTTSWLRGHLMPGSQYADPASISESLDRQKQTLLGAFPGLEPDENIDGTDDDPLGLNK